MDEKYIQDLYNGLGGSEVFGSYDKYKELISTDSSYVKDIHNNFGEETLGSFENFSKLVMGKPEAVATEDAPVTAEVEAVDTELASGNGLSELQEPKSKTYLPEIDSFEDYDVDALQMTQPWVIAGTTAVAFSNEKVTGAIKYHEELSDAADKIMSGIQDIDLDLLESQNKQLKSSIASSEFALSTRGLSQPERKRAKENIKNKKTSILKNDILISNKLIEDGNIEDALLSFESITDDFSVLTGREGAIYKDVYYNVENALIKKVDEDISKLNLKELTEIDFNGIQRADIEKVNEFASNLAKQYLPEGARVETSNVYRIVYEKLKLKVEQFKYIEPTKKAAEEDPRYEPLIEKIGEDEWDNFVETSSEAKVLIEQGDSIFNNVQSELNGKLDSYYKNNVVLSIKNYEDKLKQDIYNRVISVEEANEKLNSYQTQQINKYNLVEEDYNKKANELFKEKAALINKDIDVLYKSFKEEYNIPSQDLDELNKIYSDAYKKTIEDEGARLKLNEDISALRYGYRYMAISNFGKSFNESFSRSISSAGILLNQPSLVTLGDEMATSFSIAPDKLENFSDLLDLSKVSKSAGRLAGSAATSIVVSSLVGTATGGLGVVPALAITAAAGMMTETMDMAGTMYRDVLAQTGSIDKANKSRDETIKAQMGNWYLYTFHGLPYVGKALRGIKRTGGRVLLAGGVESLTETAQEVPQTAQEETIMERALSGEEITADGWFEKVTPKLIKETFLEVAPGSFLMGGGGRVMTEALQSGEKNKFVDELMANYAISNVQESDEFLKQEIVKSISRFGKNFTTSWVTTLKQTGKFGDEKAFSDAIRYINNANNLINSPTYSKLDSKNQSIYAYFLNEYETKKQEAELSKDPISQREAKEAKTQLDNFISFVRPASFIERSLGERREAKKPEFSYVEVQVGDRDVMIMSGEQLIKMTEENPEFFITDIGLDLKVTINNNPELTAQFYERFDAINDLAKELVSSEAAPAEVEKLRAEEQAEINQEEAQKAENRKSRIDNAPKIFGKSHTDKRLPYGEAVIADITSPDSKGVQTAKYNNPQTGELDVIISSSGNSDNFVGFTRVYENGKPTNKFTGKMQSTGNAFKNMITEAENALPNKAEVVETTNISIGGLKTYNKSKTLNEKVDSDGNVVTKTTRYSDATQQSVKEKGNEEAFSDFRTDDKTKAEAEVKKIKEAYPEIEVKIKRQGTKRGKKTYTIDIEFPVLVKTETAPLEIKVPEKFNNAIVSVSKGESINEVELEDSINEAYDYLSEIENNNSEDAETMRSLVEDEIEKLENYDNITETQTRKIAEEKTVRTVKKTPRKTIPKREKDFVGKKATYSDNKGAGGRGSIIIQEGPDGRDYYVIEQADDAKVILGRRDKAFSDGVVNFDENNNPVSVTFPMSEGKQVTVKDPAIAQEFELEQMKQPEYDEQIFEETYIEFVGEEKIEVPKPKETTKSAPKTESAPTETTKSTAKERVLSKFEKGRVQNKVRKQDVIQEAEQEGLTRKETIEVLQELGFTKDEIRSAMKPVKEKARPVASETTGLSPREAFKQGFTEFFDAIQRGKKEARQKAAENLKEKLNKVRESFKKKLQKEKDNKTARAAVVKEIRAIIKDSGISQFSKRTINKIMTNVKNTNVSNMQRMVDEVMDVVNRDIDRKVRAARYKTLKAAINKLSRLGALKELQKPLMEVLSINPDYLSKTALNFYDRVVINLANVEKKFDSRDSREDLKNAAEEVIRRFTIDNIRAEQLAEETINPNLDLTKTKGENLKQMLKDGLISDSDFELMTRFEDLIGSTTKEGLTLEELEQKAKERRDNAIEDFEAAMDEIPSSLPNLSRDDAEALRFANGLKMKDLESLSTAQIKMLTRGLEMLQAGFVTTNLVQSKIRVEAKREVTNTLISETEERGKLDSSISKAKVFVKNLFRKRDKMITSIENRIKSTPLANIDQILNAGAKKFKSTRIYESIFRPAGAAFSKTEDFLKQVKKKLQVADSILDININKRYVQKAKVMIYQIQREFESNPKNKEVNEATKWIEATLNDAESNISDKERKAIEKIRDEFTVNGQIDSKKLLDSLTSKEKKYMAIIDELYKSVEFMVAADAKMQGKPFVLRENYVHLPNVTKSKNSMSSDLEAISNSFANPALKNKALTQRTGNAHAISFDPTFNVNGITKKAAISYYMYPAVKKAKITLEGVKQNAQTDFQKETADALESVFDGIVKSQYAHLARERAFIEKALAFLGRTGYLAQLAGPVKAAVELTTNLTHALFVNPDGLISGFDTLRDNSRDVMNKAIGFLPTNQLNRLSGEGIKDSKEIDSRLINDSLNVFEQEEMTSEFRAKVSTIFKFAKKPASAIIKFNENLISRPDTIVARPLFVGVFNKSFENIAQEKPNWDKIANDQAYRDKFRDAINQATEDADTAVVDNAASNNPFDGIPKNVLDKDATPTKQALQMVDRYMTRFRTFEYYSALKAIQGLMGKGKLTPTQGAMLLTGTVVRLSIYKMGIDMAFTLIFSMLGIDEEEDEIDLEKDLTKGVLGAVATLALGRSFGNISQMPINYGIEWLNKEYGEGITRSGEYNQYKDGVVFSKIPQEVKPQDNMVEKIVTSSLGSYTPMVKTLTRAGKLATRAETLKTEEARDKNFGELTTRIPFEIAGNLGVIPGYKSLRKIYNQYLFEAVNKNKSKGNERTDTSKRDTRRSSRRDTRRSSRREN